MPLLHEGQQSISDPWTVFTDEQILSSDQEYVIVNLQRFLQLAHNGEPLPEGVSVAPADNVSLLASHLHKLSLICIEFPVYTDGRGYSHARLLRKRLNYQGELRAVGDIRADQFLFLQRLGITSFDCITLPDQALIEQLVTRFEHNYQPSYGLPIAV